MIANTPKPPYYAVIFTSIRTEGDGGYDHMSSSMMDLVKDQAGFLGVESVRKELGITVSYWKSLESIMAWRHDMEHSVAREKGRSEWYERFQVRICKVEKEYGFEK